MHPEQPAEQSVDDARAVVDTKQLVEVVKEEVKGGEAIEGPTPFDYLWLPAKTELIKDEPLGRQPCLGLAAADRQGLRPGGEPADQGEVRARPAALFRSPGLARRHRELRHLPQPGQGLDRRHAGLDRNRRAGGGRSAPSVLNTAYGKTMFWDGRAPSLEAQAEGPIQNPIEMGKQSYKEIVERLRKIPGVQGAVQKVFGTSVTLDGMAKAIATLRARGGALGQLEVRQVQRWRQEGPVREREARAWSSSGSRSTPMMSSRPTSSARRRSARSVTSASISPTSSSTTWHRLERARSAGSPTWAGGSIDPDRWPRAIRAWVRSRRRRSATPSMTAPYMHDGSLATLEDVVEHYDKGGTPNPRSTRT